MSEAPDESDRTQAHVRTTARIERISPSSWSRRNQNQGAVAMNMEGPCLFYPVIPAKAGIHFSYAWERGRPMNVI